MGQLEIKIKALNEILNDIEEIDKLCIPINKESIKHLINTKIKSIKNAKKLD